MGGKWRRTGAFHFPECQPSLNSSVLRNLHPLHTYPAYAWSIKCRGTSSSAFQSKFLASSRCQLAVIWLQGVGRDLLLLKNFYSPHLYPHSPLSHSVPDWNLSRVCHVNVMRLSRSLSILQFVFCLCSDLISLYHKTRGECCESPALSPPKLSSHSHFRFPSFQILLAFLACSSPLSLPCPFEFTLFYAFAINFGGF